MNRILKFINNINKIKISFLSDDKNFIDNFERQIMNSEDYCLYQKLTDVKDIDNFNNVLILKGLKVNDYLKSLIDVECNIPVVIDSEVKINNLLLKQYNKKNSISILK